MESDSIVADHTFVQQRDKQLRPEAAQLIEKPHQD
jgi:hypothetical protein